MRIYCTAFAVCVFFAANAFANQGASTYEEKRIKGRLGVGFTTPLAITSLGRMHALSAKYYLGRDIAASVGLGFDTRSNNSALGLGTKFYSNVFYESNLIFFLGASLAYVNHLGSRLHLGAFLGSEFFFAQLPSLGFGFEAGVQGDSTSGSFALRTNIATSVHFYF